MSERKLSAEQKKMIETLQAALPSLRKELGISQTELADKIGVSRQIISLIERQKQDMTWTMFLATVFFFKCNNDFERGEKKVVKKYPNVVEQLMFLENRMNDHKSEEKKED